MPDLPVSRWRLIDVGQKKRGFQTLIVVVIIDKILFQGAS